MQGVVMPDPGVASGVRDLRVVPHRVHGRAIARSPGHRGARGDASASRHARYSRYAKSFTLLPDFFVEPLAYVDALAAAVHATGSTVLFPCHEDVELVIRHRDRFPVDLQVAVPTLASWETAEDKLTCTRHARLQDCPIPETHERTSIAELSGLARDLVYPVVVKTRIGNSAKGVRIARTADELERSVVDLVAAFDLPPDRLPIVQSFVRGPKLGFLGVFDRGRHVSSIVFEILRSKGAANFGTSTFRVTIDDEVTRSNAIRLMESLEWHGVVDMDWLRGDDGVARLIDVNGRLGGATALTMVAGMDLPYAWFRVATATGSSSSAPPRVGAKARWILGDALGLVDAAVKGRIGECFSVLRPHPSCGHDDLVWHDPVPFAAQGVDYLRKFAAAGGSRNPVAKGMIR